uniref:V-set and transmembrane domain containing 2 like n=1 Tax=Sphenodon punctatus TaxID=8508 RepID=A0A8D0HIC6_SPHPU
MTSHSLRNWEGGTLFQAELSSWAVAVPFLSPAALFTEAPHDMTARAGEDVEMIQWWYMRNYKDWTDKQTWASNQVSEETGKDATKISVVKVVGSNISHKLRLSKVKPTDEGTYECRVIDFSDGKAHHHKVKAYLRVESEDNTEPHRHGSSAAGSHPPHQHHQHHKPGKEMRKCSADDASCTL